MTAPRKLCALALACGALTTMEPVAAAEPMPNLVTRAPSDLQIGRPDDAGDPSDTRTGLRFSSTIANLGDEAFEFLGVPDVAGDPEAATAYQCVAFASRACIAHEPRGSILWHAPHQHFHVQAFAAYGIYALDGAGEPDRAAGPIVSASKVSFCLMDSSREHEPEPLELNVAFYNTCTMAMQGISPGWGDIYEFDLPGQFLPLDGVPDGRYALVIEADPNKQFLQATSADDIAWTVFTVSGAGTTIIVDEGQP